MIFSRRVFGFLRNSRAIYLKEFPMEIFQLRIKDIGGHLPSFLVIVSIKHNTTNSSKDVWLRFLRSIDL